MPPPRLGLSLRLHVGDCIAIGPGKADLLDAIAASGSIAGAARSMGLSYRRAWVMVETMNAAFATPLVAARKGGSAGGGTALTALGREMLAAYRAMAAAAGAAAAPEAARIAARLKP